MPAFPSVISANLSLDAWTHTPVVPLVHLPVSSQGDDGLHHAESGSALNNLSVPQLLYGVASRGYSHSLMFRPPDLLATQVAPTASRFPSQGSRGFYFHAYLGLLPPRAVDMLAVRNRVTDGAGTSTPQDSRPCWPLPRRCHNISPIARVVTRPLSEPDKRISQHPAPRSIIQRASALRMGFRSMPIRTLGQPIQSNA